MRNSKNYQYLLNDVSKLRRVGTKTKDLLKKKKIKTLFDVLWNLPHSYTDRSEEKKINELEIGKICTLKIKVVKYNFPRMRNLPNKVLCEDETGKLDVIFFNSREGYIKKILPLNEYVIISGKINFYKNKYQITNPTYVNTLEKGNFIKKIIPKYSLTEGISEKIYRNIIEQILENLPNIEEWHNEEIINKYKFEGWSESIIKLHDPKNINKINSSYYKRLVFDEILSTFLVLSEIRQKIKKIKKTSKKFLETDSNKIINSLNFNLTKNQKKIINEIDIDLKSKNKMFRLLQGDVGSGKTIIALICASNVVQSGFQVAFMAPTGILAEQHFKLAKKIFQNLNINFELLMANTDGGNKKKILNNLKENKINIIFGTHALFQKKVLFNKLGLIIIDEQHKFGVKQRMSLSIKGGNNCDVLLMSATPIPRTLMMSVYGDMDVSRLIEKPANRKEVITLSKPDTKLNEILRFVKKEMLHGNQVFWVCPLIDESKKIDHESAIKKYKFLNNIFPNLVGLIHGSLNREEKEKTLKLFLNKKYKILVSTTVIEVGIDFPNANIIIIENSNKFGLSQLHQLRGRVGRGTKQGICVLMYKKNLSENARKRIKILKSSNDGFIIADEDMKLRGYGDILGYKQSGIKEFKLADPIHHQDLFELAEKEIKKIEINKVNFERYKPLLKLYDLADIINDLN